MAIQKKVDLNQPLDEKNASSLANVDLSPEYSEAALRLHGDYYRQLQGKCNRYIFWHPYSVMIFLVLSLSFSFFKLLDFIVEAKSVKEFFGYFANNNDFRFQVMSLLPFFAFLFATIGGLSYFVSDGFQEISNKLTEKEYLEGIFGFDLNKFANLPMPPKSPKEVELAKLGQNSNLIVYRDAPIAVMTLKPLPDRSSMSNYMVKITGLNVRRVFASVDFETFLIETAFIRAREIFHENYKKNQDVEGCKINVLIDAYSFDKESISRLKDLKFGKLMSSSEIDPFLIERVGTNIKLKGGFFQLIRKLFGITRDTYGVTLLVKNASEDLILSSSKKVSSEDGFRSRKGKK